MLFTTTLRPRSRLCWGALHKIYGNLSNLELDYRRPSGKKCVKLLENIAAYEIRVSINYKNKE